MGSEQVTVALHESTGPRQRGRVPRGAVVRVVGAGLAALVVAVVVQSVGPGREAAPVAAAPASCASGYSPTAVGEAAQVALDGTVIAVGPRHVSLGVEPYDYVSVTLDVHRWFRGGVGGTAVVDLFAPGDGAGIEDAGPDYRVGTRLLLAGVRPPADAATTADAVAWWSCGFARVYTPGEAGLWATAIG